MKTLHMWQEERRTQAGWTTVAAIFELPDQTRTRLWFRVPEAYAPMLTQVCDPFVAGYIFYLMRHADRCVVHDQVSPSFLRNLEEFQTVWTCWRPTMYHPVEIIADSEREPVYPNQNMGALIGFSGGVDSSFSAWRHRTHQAGRRTQNLTAGVIVQGFSIPLESDSAFDRATVELTKTLDSIGMSLIPLKTNLRQISDTDNWWDANVTAVASALMILAGGYSAGLLAAGYPYQALQLPAGSNPITDNLLSSNSFAIVNDGAGFTRPQKVRALAQWSEGLRHLRVCARLEHGTADHTCGRCEKCRRTILCFRSVGLSLPPCFEHDLNLWQVLTHANPREVLYVPEILQTIQANRISGAWVWALYLSYWKSWVGLGIRKLLARKH